MNKKVIAAIGGAIGMFLQAELQHLAVYAAETGKVPEAPSAACSPWVIAGRQSMMDMRRFLQMRLVR